MVYLAIIQYKYIWVFTAFKLIFDKNLLHVLADNFNPGPAGLRHCSRGTSRIFFMQPFLHSFAWKDDERRHLLSYTITYINYSCCLGLAFCYCLCLGWGSTNNFWVLIFSWKSLFISVKYGLVLKIIFPRISLILMKFASNNRCCSTYSSSNQPASWPFSYFSSGHHPIKSYNHCRLRPLDLSYRPRWSVKSDAVFISCYLE